MAQVNQGADPEVRPGIDRLHLPDCGRRPGQPGNCLPVATLHGRTGVPNVPEIPVIKPPYNPQQSQVTCPSEL